MPDPQQVALQVELFLILHIGELAQEIEVSDGYSLEHQN